MGTEIVTLRDGHIEDAAALVASRYRHLRKNVAVLPSCYENKDSMVVLLSNTAKNNSGVAAIDGKHLIGFLTAMTISNFRGKRTAYSPEWANAAKLAQSRQIYQKMYTHLSEKWFEDGCLCHMVTLFPDDPEAIEVWFWEDFGLIAVDAMRGLDSVKGTSPNIEIKAAELKDIDSVMFLDRELSRELSLAPTFLYGEQNEPKEYFEQLLRDSRNRIWLALYAGKAVACMRFGSANPDTCQIIQDEKTTSISSAYTVKGLRSKDIGTALLNCGLECARSVGYERCAVDFEPMNVSGSRFWLRHFKPICYTLIRYLDPRFDQ